MNKRNKRGAVFLFGACLGLIAWLTWEIHSLGQPTDHATEATPLVVLSEQKEVRVFGRIFPARFNAASGAEAQYHFLVWNEGTSPGALIQTPVDDLDFHDAILRLGAKPSNNLSMAAWTKRHDHNHPEPKQTVAGSHISVRISWADNPTGLFLDQALHNSVLSPQSSVLSPRFGGNRNRWFNRVPLMSRPGCLVCLYSCPSGKISNGALSIAEYVRLPHRFRADTETLPPDGTPVTVIFTLRS